MGSEGETIRASKVVSQISGQQLSALDGLVAFDRVVDERNPASIPRPQDSDKESIVSKPQPAAPVAEITHSIPSIHVEAVRGQEDVAALNFLDELEIQRTRGIWIGLRVRTDYDVGKSSDRVAAG